MGFGMAGNAHWHRAVMPHREEGTSTSSAPVGRSGAGAGDGALGEEGSRARRRSRTVGVIAVAAVVLFSLPVDFGPLIHTVHLDERVLSSQPEAAPVLPVIGDAATDQAPYRFHSLDTASVIPSARYEAGRIWRSIFGEGYRALWTTPVAVPVIDLERTAGGLTVLEEGGGTQTRSLHLKGADGHFYVVRSVDKDVSPLIPLPFRRTLGATLVRDVMAGINPYAALAIPTLAEAAGILHTEPTLAVLPDSPRLGTHREAFAGMLTLFERKPDEDQSEARRFGHSRNVIGTEKLFEELVEEEHDQVNQRLYARSRLFDMWIGDWDRGGPQWRWAEQETSLGTRYDPVPRDRDYAFSSFDGLIVRMGQLVRIPFMRRFRAFDGDMSDLFGLNSQAADLDRRFTSRLTRSDWIEIADSLQGALADSVVVRALRAWPASAVEIAGERTIRVLTQRRALLSGVAGRYFDALAAGFPDPDEPMEPVHSNLRP